MSVSTKKWKTGADDKLPGFREALITALKDQLEKNWRYNMRPYGPISVETRGSGLRVSYNGTHFEVQVRQKK